MIAHEILPQPASTYQLLLDAARTWPDSVATQWIPDPGDYPRCVTWTYADLAGTVTQIANALTALGVRRHDAVTLTAPNTSMLCAATLAAQAAGIAAPVNPALSDEHLSGITMDDLGFTERWLVIDIRSAKPLDTWDGVEQICDPARSRVPGACRARPGRSCWLRRRRRRAAGTPTGSGGR